MRESGGAAVSNQRLTKVRQPASFRLPLVCLALCAALIGAGALADEAPADSGARAPLQPIAALDVPRYMGTWYEIAKYPNWFQRKCVADTRADYRLMPDGSVQVTNRCKTASGELIDAVGQARQLGPANSPKLEVRFAPAWLAFLPFVWGDYWVIDLDEAYQLVAVSEPKRDYLWILARTPQVDPQKYQNLLARLAKKGFDLSKLEVSKQD
ncbi:MAG: lipocalin family protein [Aquabacterium sp.]|nr:lipocalin family protein [Aquabacterium sp.]